MIFYYDIETKDGTIEIEFEPSFTEERKALEYIVKNKSPKEIVSDMQELIGEESVESYYHDELKEYFESEAIKEYKEREETKADMYFDYYHDKL